MDEENKPIVGALDDDGSNDGFDIPEKIELEVEENENNADGAADNGDEAGDDDANDEEQDGAGESADGDDAGAEDEGEEGDNKDEKSGDGDKKDEEPARPSSDVRVEPVEDPGEFKPGDYSFEVTYVDGETSKTVKITKPEDIDQLPDQPEWRSAKDFVKFQADYNKMVMGIETDRRNYEAEKAKFDDYSKSTEDQQKQIETWDSEIRYMMEGGELPKIKDELWQVDWSDPKYADEPGIKETVELFEYMAKENVRRDKVGLPHMTSLLEARQRLENEQLKQDKKATTDREKQIRKEKGARVVGSSNNQKTPLPKDLIVGEGGSLSDINIDILG